MLGLGLRIEDLGVRVWAWCFGFRRGDKTTRTMKNQMQNGLETGFVGVQVGIVMQGPNLLEWGVGEFCFINISRSYEEKIGKHSGDYNTFWMLAKRCRDVKVRWAPTPIM